MSRLCVVFLLVVGVYECRGCDVKAPLPKQDPPIDMGQFKGAWYETLKTYDAISQGHACQVFTDFADTMNPAGYRAVQTFYYDNAPPSSNGVHISVTEAGNFKQRTIEQKQQFGYEENENAGHIDPKAASEYVELHWKEYSLLGDPDHYVAYVNCASTGWVISVATKVKVMTPELFTYIHNDLLKYGVSAPLGLGRCENIAEK